MTDSPELASQKLLDMLPDGCELETTVMPEGLEWKATARVRNPKDSPSPLYAGIGASEEAAILSAISACADFWSTRRSGGLRNWNPLTQSFNEALP